MKKLLQSFLTISLVLTAFVGHSQANFGFEDGTFTGWTGTWQDRNISRINDTIIPGQLMMGFDQHCILSQGTMDPVILSLSAVPTGKLYAARIGNVGSGGYLATLKRTFTVDSSNMVFSYSFAVVLEDPLDAPDHEELKRPHFTATMNDQNGNEIPCSEYTVFVVPGLNNFVHHCMDFNSEHTEENVGCGPFSVEPAFYSEPTTLESCDLAGMGYDIFYKKWETISISLANYIGQNVTIEFTVADCVPNGHMGYAYVSAEATSITSPENPTFINSGIETKTLTAPAGFASYKWTGPGIISSDTTREININHAGTYSVVVAQKYHTNNPACQTPFTYIVNEGTISSVYSRFSSSEIRSYPNPAKDFLFTDLLEADFNGYAVGISDLTGKKYVTKAMTENNRLKVSLNELPQGMFVLTVRGKERVWYSRFVKE